MTSTTAEQKISPLRPAILYSSTLHDIVDNDRTEARYSAPLPGACPSARPSIWTISSKWMWEIMLVEPNKTVAKLGLARIAGLRISGHHVTRFDRRAHLCYPHETGHDNRLRRVGRDQRHRFGVRHWRHAAHANKSPSPCSPAAIARP